VFAYIGSLTTQPEIAMNDREYQEQARLTISTQWNADKVSAGALMECVLSCIDASNKLDRFKKALFYGKFAEDVKIGENRFPLANLHFSKKERDLIHGILGAHTETGELLEAFLSVLNGRLSLEPDNGSFDHININEECGDAQWYLAAIADAIDIPMEESKIVNIAKLRKRYGEKFSAYDANNRDLIAERLILESAGMGVGELSDQLRLAIGEDEPLPENATATEVQRRNARRMDRENWPFPTPNAKPDEKAKHDGYISPSTDGY
jgi:NTP pyrophosphatase (non-canonical NTP hydrolase)